MFFCHRLRYLYNFILFIRLDILKLEHFEVILLRLINYTIKYKQL